MPTRLYKSNTSEGHIGNSSTDSPRKIALEAGGHYYWLVDEIQQAGHQSHLANPPEAKKARDAWARRRTRRTLKSWPCSCETEPCRRSGFLRLSCAISGNSSGCVCFWLGKGRSERIEFVVHWRTTTWCWQPRTCSPWRGDSNLVVVWQNFRTTPAKALDRNSSRSTSSRCRSRTPRELATVLETSAEADLLKLKTLPYVGRILSTVMALEIGNVNRSRGQPTWTALVEVRSLQDPRRRYSGQDEGWKRSR